MGLQEELKTLSDKIKQYRDEARVQLHLARQDVKDEFDDLDQEWGKFRTRFDQVVDDASDASQEARQTAKKLGEDLKTGYQNIRDKIK
jgi:predicted  nucleic acid-binding Zn-ribbon protein